MLEIERLKALLFETTMQRDTAFEEVQQLKAEAEAAAGAGARAREGMGGIGVGAGQGAGSGRDKASPPQEEMESEVWGVQCGLCVVFTYTRRVY